MELIHEIERLAIRDDEVLVVRPTRMLGREETEMLHRRIAAIATRMGWGVDRFVILDRDVELSVIKAEQVGFDLADPGPPTMTYFEKGEPVPDAAGAGR